MSHSPITVEMRLMSDDEASAILTHGLRHYLPGATELAAEKILDVLSRAHVLLLCPINKPIPADDETAAQL